MPKRNTKSPTDTTPKKSKTNSTASPKLNSNNVKNVLGEIEPSVNATLEQLSSSEEGEAETESDGEANNEILNNKLSPRARKDNLTKRQIAKLGFVVEEDDTCDDRNEQGPLQPPTVNGQDKNIDNENTVSGLKRKRNSASESSPKKQAASNKSEVSNPVVSINKLKEEFTEKVNQFYDQALTEEQDDEDNNNEVVIDIATVRGFRVLYSRGIDEESGERKLLIDQFFREYLLDNVTLNNKPWHLFLELSIKLAREEIASPGVPISLLSDLVELSDLPECEAVFHFIEQRLSIWKESLFDSCKHSVLRLCNDLLRRLSREQDTVFCGKILIFLANYFPFAERSGLNIMSEFNIENLTLYKQNTAEKGDDDDDKMEIGEEKSVEKLFDGLSIEIPGLEEMIALCQQENKKNVQLDYNLYVKFWSMQDFFRNPIQCYNKLHWRTFVTYTNEVLQAFKCYKLDESSSTVKRRKDKIAASEQMDCHQSELSKKVPAASTPSTSTSSINIIPKFGDETYFPKYLTNKRLIDLQVGDPNFRRYFLIQLLIVLQYLTLTVKFKSDVHVLNEDQLDFVKKTEEQIYEQLSQIPPEGTEFASNIRHIIKTEKFWNKWKNDSCPPFKKPTPTAVHPLDLKEDLVRSENETFSGDKEGTNELSLEDGIKFISKTKERPAIGDVIEDAHEKKKRYLLGNSELTRLWNICPNNLDSCRSGERNFTPSMDTFFMDAMKELDATDPSPPAEPKKEVRPKKILGSANFGWRALRLLARKSPLFFQMHPGSPIHPMQTYLEYILKKMTQEMELPIANQTNETPIKGEILDEGKEDGNGETEMEQGTEDEDDEMLGNPGTSKDDERLADTYEERVELDEKLRNLTEEEQTKLGKVLGADWKKLAQKLSFKKDEIEYFISEKKENAGAWMLKMWTEQEGEDASIAELLYILEGLGLRAKADEVIKLGQTS